MCIRDSKLTILRDKDTSVKDFREIVSEIGMLITIRSTPSTSPRPARRMGTTANFLPFRVGAMVLQMGVSTSLVVRGRSRVAS